MVVLGVYRGDTDYPAINMTLFLEYVALWSPIIDNIVPGSGCPTLSGTQSYPPYATSQRVGRT